MTNIAEKYTKFQNDFGAYKSQDYAAVIENLFSPEFYKIANGQTLVNNRDELNSQLTSVREYAGGWNMDITQIIPSANDHKYVIRYILNTKKAGKFDVIAILGSNDGIKIDSVDEIYYQFGV